MALSTKKIQLVSTRLESLACKTDAPSCLTSESATARKDVLVSGSNKRKLERKTH